MKLVELGKAFSRQYFSTRKKMKDMFETYIQKDLKKEKRYFYKKYGVEATEDDVQEIKKDIVMKQGLLLFIVVLIITFILFL